MSANIQSLVFENDTDFEEMMPACWEAFEDPFATFLRIVFYLKGNTPEDRKESIAASAAGLRAFHQMNPNSHWIKAIELDTGKIIGAANWLLYKESPYTGVQREPIVAVWWPEGEGRNYATHYMRQIEAHKPIQYNRPHVYLNISFTVPEWRRRGVGSLLMEWGVQKADEMGVDSFVEASASGRLLYAKFGFLTYKKLIVDTKVENPSKEWLELEKSLAPEPQYLMWRPIGGKLEPGKTSLPWESVPFVPEVID